MKADKEVFNQDSIFDDYVETILKEKGVFDIEKIRVSLASKYNRYNTSNRKAKAKHDDLLKEFIPDTQLNRKKFKLLLSNFNKEIRKQILDGKSFKMPYKLGTITVVKLKQSLLTKNGTPKINWALSAKRKKELILEGRIPLQGDNGGEPWIVYNTKEYFFNLTWLKHGFVKGEKVYTVLPTSEYTFNGNIDFKKEVQKVMNKREDLEI